MVKLVNRAKMTIASGGAGDITLGTAVNGYQTFADAGVSDTDVLRYTIEDGDDWEIGTGVYTASGTTLVRTVTESSNSDAALTCSADAVIFVTMAAEDFTDNAAPAFVNTIPSSVDLVPDASTSVTIDAKAVDDDGFPITYTFDGYSGNTVYSDSSLPPQLNAAPSIDQSTGVFSLIGSSNSSNAGNFNLRVRASDGVRTATKNVICNLFFFPRTNLVGLYDAASSNSYSGLGTAFSDMSGSGGPDLTLGSAATYNSSGKGGVASFTLTGASAITYSGSAFGFAATVFAIFSSTETDLATHGLIGSDVSGSEGLFMDNGTSTIAARRSTSNGGTSVGTTGSTIIYIDKVTQEYTRNEMFDEMGNGAYRSLTYTHARIGAGFNFNTDSSTSHTEGELRAIAIYSSTPSVADITALHAYFKGDYSNSSDMAS
jgi:hypothetical protein